MKKYSIFVVLLLVLVLLCGCGANDKGYEPLPNGNSDEKAFNIVLTENRLLVYSANITLTVDKIETARATIDAKLAEYGGYFSNYTQNRSGYFRATYKLPTVHLEDFLNSLDGLGQITDGTVESEDITDQYTAVAKQKEAYEAQYKTIEQMLDEANKNGASVTEREYLANRLVELSRLIDQSSSQMEKYKSLAEYSTVYLTMYSQEDYTEPSYWEELGDVLSGSTSSVGKVLGFFLKVLVALLPYAILAAGVWGIYLFVLFVVCKCKHKPFKPFAGMRERRLIRQKIKEQRNEQMKKYLE